MGFPYWNYKMNADAKIYPVERVNPVKIWKMSICGDESRPKENEQKFCLSESMENVECSRGLSIYSHRYTQGENESK